MVCVPYVCCSKKFEEHYAEQKGSGMAFYRGNHLQRGYGVGGMFRSLFRKVLPFLVKGAKTVGKSVLRTGTQIASDVLEGQNLKQSAEKRVHEESKSLARRAINKAQNMLGKGKYKRKRKTAKRVISPKKRKVIARDIFDP